MKDYKMEFVGNGQYVLKVNGQIKVIGYYDEVFECFQSWNRAAVEKLKYTLEKAKKQGRY